MRNKGRDEDFTMIQGEVTGLRILEAHPAEGMLNALNELSEKGIEMVILAINQIPISWTKIRSTQSSVELA